MKNRLREIREGRGMSLDTVGEAIGMSKAQLSRLETGERKLDLEYLVDFARYYDIGIDEIVDVPLSGKFDGMRMETALGYIVEACEKHKIDAKVRQISKWAKQVYDNSIKLRLTPKLMKQLAEHFVLDAKGKKPVK